MTRTTAPSKRWAATLSGTAVAVLAVSLAATPTASAQIPPPEAPTITTTVDGNQVTIDLQDPNRGLAHALTACTAALVDPAKAVNLIPAIAAGTIPPISEIDPEVFTWGPSLVTTNALVRQRTYDVGEIPAGIYIALGICINPNITNPAIDFEPVLVGNKIELGSAVIDLGSTVIDTPGALAAILDLLGIDTGSLGSAGSGDGSVSGSGDGSATASGGGS